MQPAPAPGSASSSIPKATKDSAQDAAAQDDDSELLSEVIDSQRSFGTDDDRGLNEERSE